MLRPGLVAQAALGVLTIACLTAEGPTAVWRHSGIGGGRVTGNAFSSPNQLRAWMAAERRSIVWEADGVESSVALALDPTGYAFIVNGKSDGSARGDAGTQVAFGLIGALAHPGPRRALVIGLGTGSSAGWLGAMPSMDRVDVVELESLVLDVARASEPVNHDVMRNPKVQITIGDARETLLTSRDLFDIIASEPSNPFRAGIASLFTLEFYRAAADRLTDEGVLAQWVQGYEIDARTLRTIYATLGAVFPQIDTWQTNRGDLVLVASKRPHTYRVRDLAARIAEEPFKSALAHVWRAVDVHGLLAHYLANDQVARAIAASPGVEVNTDDRNVVEFGLARSVGRGTLMVAELRGVARASGFARPPLEDAPAIGWPAVDTAWLAYNASEGQFFEGQLQGPPEEQARQAALLRYYQNGDAAAARELWRQQTEPPRDPSELTMVADIIALTGSDEALPFIERLRGYDPGEADTILAGLRVAQGRYADAAAALEAALLRFRTDPWPTLRFQEKAVQIADVLAARDPSLAARTFEALGQPFAVRAIEDTRRITYAELTARFDFVGKCREAIDALEPNVPWTERFLRMRRDCYQATEDGRLAQAALDLEEFLRFQAPLVQAR